MRYIYQFVFVVVMFVSCKEAAPGPINPENQEGIEVVIDFSAGNRWEESEEFLPLPFNIGSINDKQFIILNDRMKVGERLRVEALGAIQIEQNDSTHVYVIAQPTLKSASNFKVNDFDEFSTVHSSAKWIIEQYMVNHSGVGVSKLKSWEDRGFAVKHLLK